MSTMHNLETLLTAIKVLKDLPAQKLAENGILMSEIQDVFSSNNLSGLLNTMMADYRREQDASFNTPRSSAGLTPDSVDFIRLYAQYKTKAHDIVAKNAAAAFTRPIDMTEAQAFNGKRDNPLVSAAVLGLKEAKTFAEAYNSIFSDRALQIGTSQDPTRLSSYIDYSPYQWNYLYYLSIPTLAPTIDRSIQIATRQPPTIEFRDRGLSQAVEKVLKRGRFWERVQQMLLYSHLSPRGSLLVPILDADGTIRFNTFNDTQFTYSTSYQYSRIDFRENMTGVSQIYVLGHLLQNDVTAFFLCPGFEPLYAIGKNKAYQLKDAAEAMNIYVYTIKVLCIRAQVMVQEWGGEGQTDTMLKRMRTLTEDINSSLSLSTAVQLPQGAKLDILNNNISEGFSNIAPVIKEYQGMLSGIMPDYLYGSDTAYAANTFNIHATHQNIRSDIQESQIEPIVRFAVNQYLKSDRRFSQWADQIDEFDITFPSLYEMTESEKVDTDAKKIKNILDMAQYPELAEIFKKEGLLKNEYVLPELVGPVPDDPLLTRHTATDEQSGLGDAV